MQIWVCGHLSCKQPVHKGGNRMTAFTGDHLKTVMRPLLRIPAFESRVIVRPDRYRVHASHLEDGDKLPSQGGAVKVKPPATPMPFSRMFRQPSPKKPVSGASVTPEGSTQVHLFMRPISSGAEATPRAPLSPLIANGPATRRTLGLTRPRPRVTELLTTKKRARQVGEAAGWGAAASW
eukprot:CAMPEP_0117673544 /NCGR_PEP_ID=MMETSP0804-20121206/14532_1 /TAXON_ID=1074897 /ORGANISM="Tetraselmis astigmatica, Strain CCMP880" /LENGTH=178 /DNA_ID=CAMNT_0005482295 /DNA_START=53 /DNA_END=587 /DNA_ORIENTATION=-